MQASLCMNRAQSSQAHIHPLRSHIKEQKMNCLKVLFSCHNNRNIFISISLNLRYRCANDFLDALLPIVLIHSCVKYVTYEWYLMKEEILSLTNVYWLLIIIVIKIWINIDKSRFRFFWDTLYNSGPEKLARAEWSAVQFTIAFLLLYNVS